MSDPAPIVRPTALRLSTVATSTRKAHRADFGTLFRAGVAKVGWAAEQGLRVAAPLVPTGPIVSAALAGPSVGSAGGPSVVASSAALTPTLDPGVPVEVGVPVHPGGGLGQVMAATERMTELNASYNLRYLQLQQRIQADTRQFNLVSNVLKTKHDAAKNALNNIR